MGCLCLGGHLRSFEASISSKNAKGVGFNIVIMIRLEDTWQI